jgi:Tfp pilus assembly protein FimT
MPFSTQNKKYSPVGGYTVVELVVAVGLFVTVALISSNAFLGVMSSNRKTLAVRTSMDNLNSAIESMSRKMKTGFSYHCGVSGSVSAPQDCPSGDSYIALEGQNGNPNISSDQVVYRLGPAGALCPSPKQICFSTDGGATFFALTAAPPELSIDGLAFRVYGAPADDSPSLPKQPRIVIVIIGSAGVGISKSTFNVETTISQRIPDFP